MHGARASATGYGFTTLKIREAAGGSSTDMPALPVFARLSALCGKNPGRKRGAGAAFAFLNAKKTIKTVKKPNSACGTGGRRIIIIYKDFETDRDSPVRKKGE
jgi:hypothetical protein